MKRSKAENISRRDFIKTGVGATVGMGVALQSGCSPAKLSENKSKVFEVFHPGVISGKRKIDQSIVREMIRQGMRAMTGSKKPWSHFISPEDRVGLKINTLGRPVLYTHHELIRAFIEELKDFGVAENNIIVWDRYEHHMVKCDFTFNTTEKGVRCYGTIGESENQYRLDFDVAYESDFDNPERRDQRLGTLSPFSSIFTQDCDKIINLAILKDHGYSGVTLCLKNLAYGISENNGRFHGPEHISPFISEFCTHPLIKKKVVLHVIDGIEGCYDRGPVPGNLDVVYEPKTLWFGTDPVAMDAVGRRVIENKRAEQGLPTFEEAGRPNNHIELAAEKGVGECRLDHIDLKKMQLGG